MGPKGLSVAVPSICLHDSASKSACSLCTKYCKMVHCQNISAKRMQTAERSVQQLLPGSVKGDRCAFSGEECSSPKSFPKFSTEALVFKTSAITDWRRFCPILHQACRCTAKVWVFLWVWRTKPSHHYQEFQQVSDLICSILFILSVQDKSTR